jgi:hypothetical protein
MSDAARIDDLHGARSKREQAAERGEPAVDCANERERLPGLQVHMRILAKRQAGTGNGQLRALATGSPHDRRPTPAISRRNQNSRTLATTAHTDILSGPPTTEAACGSLAPPQLVAVLINLLVVTAGLVAVGAAVFGAIQLGLTRRVTPARRLLTGRLAASGERFDPAHMPMGLSARTR